MQKNGACELCGKETLIGDYGPNNEFICADCGTNTEEMRDYTYKEMIRRKGKTYIDALFESVRKEMLN